MAESDPAERHAIAIEKAVKRLERDLTVSAVRKANIIQVEYVDKVPRRAVAVLSTLAEGYLEAHLKVHGTPGTYEFFKGQTERYQDELKDAESKLADFRRRENIVILEEQKTVMLQKAAESEAALRQAEAAVSEDTQRIADTRRQTRLVRAACRHTEPQRAQSVLRGASPYHVGRIAKPPHPASREVPP